MEVPLSLRECCASVRVLPISLVLLAPPPPVANANWGLRRLFARRGSGCPLPWLSRVCVCDCRVSLGRESRAQGV